MVEHVFRLKSCFNLLLGEQDIKPVVKSLVRGRRHLFLVKDRSISLRGKVWEKNNDDKNNFGEEEPPANFFHFFSSVVVCRHGKGSSRLKAMVVLKNFNGTI